MNNQDLLEKLQQTLVRSSKRNLVHVTEQRIVNASINFLKMTMDPTVTTQQLDEQLQSDANHLINSVEEYNQLITKIGTQTTTAPE